MVSLVNVKQNKYNKLVIRKANWNPKNKRNEPINIYTVKKGLITFTNYTKNEIKKLLSNKDFNSINWDEWNKKLRKENTKEKSEQEIILDLIKGKNRISFGELKEISQKYKIKINALRTDLSRLEKKKKIFSWKERIKGHYNQEIKRIKPIKQFTTNEQRALLMSRKREEYEKEFLPSNKKYTKSELGITYTHKDMKNFFEKVTKKNPDFWNNYDIYDKYEEWAKFCSFSTKQKRNFWKRMKLRPKKKTKKNKRTISSYF